tara:strand:+ start:274 stop:837 length:564 start_codon:yes stop_codon:yes gene_type:complete
MCSPPERYVPEQFHQRKSLSYIKKEKICNRCDWKCNICKTSFESPNQIEMDHIIPHAITHDDNISNFQPLCRECHIKKTRNDNKLINLIKKNGTNHLIYRYKNGNTVLVELNIGICNKQYIDLDTFIRKNIYNYECVQIKDNIYLKYYSKKIKCNIDFSYDEICEIPIYCIRSGIEIDSISFPISLD